jgi:integrase
MTGERWHQHLESYLALRRALGFTMRPEERLLRDFVRHLDQWRAATSVAQVAVDWSMATAGVSHARRLTIVRGFLTMARATDPCIDVPGRGLLRTGRRPTPHLFTPDDILALMAAARALGPRDTLRPHTVAAVIGLLASCGLRASEAIGLDVTDVTLEDGAPRLRIRQTKFHKSRLVPLHPTTADALRTYTHRRQTLGYDGLCDAFFVSERGTRLTYHTLARTFVTLARQLQLRGPVGTRGASLHHLRHSFAVDRLAAWTREGGDVRLQLPALAVYLGHVRPKDTYWYLTAAPQVLEPAAARFETYADRSVES